MENGQVDLQSGGAQVSRPPRVVDRVQGVLGLQPTYDRHTLTRGVDDGTQQSRPLVIIQVWAFAHRRGDLEHRCTCSQPALDPPLGQVGHNGSVELEVAVERTGKCSNGSLYQTFELIAVHRALHASGSPASNRPASDSVLKTCVETRTPSTPNSTSWTGETSTR